MSEIFFILEEVLFNREFQQLHDSEMRSLASILFFVMILMSKDKILPCSNEDVAHFCEWMHRVTHYLHICMLWLTLTSYLAGDRKSILKLSSCVLAAVLQILGVPPSAIHAALFMFLLTSW